MTDLEQTPDEFMDLPCRNCGHDMSVHKTGVGVLGYPCIHTEMRVESVVDTSEAESPFKDRKSVV